MMQQLNIIFLSSAGDAQCYYCVYYHHLSETVVAQGVVMIGSDACSGRHNRCHMLVRSNTTHVASYFRILQCTENICHVVHWAYHPLTYPDIALYGLGCQGPGKLGHP